MEKRAKRALCALALSMLPLLCSSGAGWAGAPQQQHHHFCIFDHQTLRTPAGVCRPRAVKYPPQVAGEVRRAVYDAALIFGIPFNVLLAIAQCESGLNPRATDGVHYGIFQFLPDTFRQGAQDLRRTTGIVARSYWSPRDSAYVAGYFFAVGHALSWGCESARPPSTAA